VLPERFYKHGLAGERIDGELEAYRNGNLLISFSSRRSMTYLVCSVMIRASYIGVSNAKEIALNATIVIAALAQAAEQWMSCSEAAPSTQSTGKRRSGRAAKGIGASQDGVL
jgi:hypothetical protein